MCRPPASGARSQTRAPDLAPFGKRAPSCDPPTRTRPATKKTQLHFLFCFDSDTAGERARPPRQRVRHRGAAAGAPRTVAGFMAGGPRQSTLLRQVRARPPWRGGLPCAPCMRGDGGRAAAGDRGPGPAGVPRGGDQQPERRRGAGEGHRRPLLPAPPSVQLRAGRAG